MQLRDVRPQEISRQGAGDIASALRQRYDRLQSLDGSQADQDPRDGYVTCPRSDGTLQVILGTSYNGVEYTARVLHDGQLVRGENASVTVAGDSSQVLASHYEASGQPARALGPADFPDITAETAQASSARLQAPTVRQWNTQAVKGQANQAVLAELPEEGARAEDYYYLHNFDLMWNPE